MAKNSKAQTRTHAPKPIPAMLEGSFGTAVENRIAEINNQLAREGRLTNDPLAVMLRSLRGTLREHGFTFDRVVPGASAPAPTSAAPKAAPASKPAAKAKSTPPPAATATAKPKARQIKPERIEELQVPGSVSEAAPYGLDAEGRALAPYGVKIDGTPMKRRGRAAAQKAEAATAASTKTADEGSEDEVEAEVEAEVAAAAEALTAEEDEVEADETPSVSEDDLDDLLEGL